MKLRKLFISIGTITFIFFLINQIPAGMESSVDKIMFFTYKTLFKPSSTKLLFLNSFFSFLWLFALCYYAAFYLGKKLLKNILVFSYIPFFIFLGLFFGKITGYYDFVSIKTSIFLGLVYVNLLLIEYFHFQSFWSENKNKLSIGSKDKYGTENMTVMFIDMQNFTEISETLNSPKLVGFFLNNYFTFIESIILEYGGVIDKILGDGALFVFRGPEKEINAIRCSIYLKTNRQKFIDYLGRAISQNGAANAAYRKILDTIKSKGFEIRIGISTGKVMIGQIGGKNINEVTIIGDKVNVAARLESLNKQYKTGILCDSDTAKKISNKVSFRIIDKVQVKGKNDHIFVYQPLKISGTNDYILDVPVSQMQDWNNIIKLYLSKKFQSAYSMLEKYIVEGKKDPTADIMYDRLKKIVTGEIKIPDDWDGTWEHKVK